MRIEIDQSGKVEDTNRKIVLAYADSKNKTKSVLISARTKKKFKNYTELRVNLNCMYTTFS